MTTPSDIYSQFTPITGPIISPLFQVSERHLHETTSHVCSKILSKQSAYYMQPIYVIKNKELTQIVRGTPRPMSQMPWFCLNRETLGGFNTE